MLKLRKVVVRLETALRYELIKAIPELNNQVFPTNAPEKAEKPYLVYIRSGTSLTKTLEGYTGQEDLSFVFNIMATTYADMSRIRNAVKGLLLVFPKTIIGNKDRYFVADLSINNMDEEYEHQLGVNRGIIDFTIYFKKENE